MTPIKDHKEPRLTDEEIRWIRENRKLIESFGIVGRFFRRVIIGSAALIIALAGLWQGWSWFIKSSVGR